MGRHRNLFSAAAGIAGRLLACLLALALLIPVLPAPAALAASDGMVRVKLTRLGSRSEITFTVGCDYYVEDRPEVRISAGSSATVSASGSGIFLTVGSQTMNMGGSLRLMRSTPGKKGISFTSPSMSNVFCGDLFLTASSSILSIVLNIYIEDYLYGVVGYEMSPSYPLEALKAQAVAARNYALRKKQERVGKEYDLVDTTSNQVFKGLNLSSTYAGVIAAVDSTRGVVLMYGGALAQCYYGASNGGQTESSKNAWGGSLGYSVVRDDPYDLSSSGSTRKAEIRKDAAYLNAEFEAALRGAVAQALSSGGVTVSATGVRINAIEGIEAINPRFAAPSRLYQTLRFTVNATATSTAGETRTGTLAVDLPSYGGFEKWYSLSINSGNNETVWVSETDTTFYVTFRRNGHGVGMSQRGAQVMARDYNMTAAEIVQFYYPGVEPVQLNLTDTTSDSATAVYTVIATAKAAESAKLYSGTSEGASCIASPAVGTAIDVYGVSGSWAAVCVNGVMGFMKTSALANYRPAGAEITQLSAPMYATVTAASGAALRELPAEEATLRETLPAGTAVAVYAYTDKWASVLTRTGAAGFVACSALTTDAVQPTPAPQMTTPATEMYARVTAALATVHDQAAANAAVLEALTKGDYVRVLAYGTEWARIRTASGREGYAAISGLTLAAPGETAAPGADVIVPAETLHALVLADTPVYAYADASSASAAELKAGGYVIVTAYTSEWAQVNADGKIGFVPIAKLRAVPAGETAPQPTPAPGADGVTTVQGTKYVYVATASATLYSSYSTDSVRLNTLPYGTRVQIGAYNSEWACVRYGSTYGFIRRSQLTERSPVAKSASDVITAEFYAETTSAVTAYAQASSASAVVGGLAGGQRVTVYAYNNEYAYIGVDRYRGFVELSKLRIVV